MLREYVRGETTNMIVDAHYAKITADLRTSRLESREIEIWYHTW
jgi:hypothetical protein